MLYSLTSTMHLFEISVSVNINWWYSVFGTNMQCQDGSDFVVCKVNQ